MNAKELIIKYPIAAMKIREWIAEKMMESLVTSEAPKEFAEEIKSRGVTESMLINIIDSNPRALFDLFDKNGIYIAIIIFVNNETNATFTYEIYPRDLESNSSDVWVTTRKEAEKSAVVDAFNLLNSQL